MSNQQKIILDLCGGTGSWARPYLEAGRVWQDGQAGAPGDYPTRVRKSIF